MDWESDTKWAWRPGRVTQQEYPVGGTDAVRGGKLKGSTSTDYFHFDCPRCGANQYGLDVELLGVRDETGPNHPTARTILLGLNCQFMRVAGSREDRLP